MLPGKQRLRYRLITAEGGPGGAEIPPAHMGGDYQIVRTSVQHQVIHPQLLLLALLVTAAVRIKRLGAPFKKLPPGAVIQLDVPAA
ncbi:hypothetical protein D3C75_973080 [compost metagenome]